MMYSMGIKSCHCCSKRSDCNLKNSSSNLLKSPVEVKKPVETKQWVRGSGKLETVVDVTVTSFCGDFELDRG